MQPLQFTLNVWQGQTFDDILTFQNSDTTPVNLTGYAAYMDVRADITDPTAIASWSSTTGELLITALTGTIQFNVSADATFALSTTNDMEIWTYDLRIVNTTSGYAQRLMQGSLVLYPAVTREPA